MISNSPAETSKIAVDLSGTLRPKDVIVLFGDLGAGKTTFIKGLCQGLGIKNNVTSPSFIIINKYCGGRIPFYHVDLYRLDNEPDICDIGVDSLFDEEAIVAVEWGQRLGSMLPKNYIQVKINYIDESKRQIEINRI